MSSVSSTPVPGRFYDIQLGRGGLLTTAGKAYALGPGGERLRLAQDINEHPLNRRFWRPPKNDFERQYFARGVIDFNPVFTCAVEQRRAKKGQQHCFARIWIPPAETVTHPQLGRGISLPADLVKPASVGSSSIADASRRVCHLLDVGCEQDSTKLSAAHTEETDTVGIPNRWSCWILVLFAEASTPGVVWAYFNGSGFLISPHHVLTAGHLLEDLLTRNVATVRGPVSQTRRARAVAAVVIPARQGHLNDVINFSGNVPEELSNVSAFGAFLVTDSRALRVAPEWSRHVQRSTGEALPNEFDYGLISLKAAERCANITALLSTMPAGYWGAKDTGTRVIATLRGFPIGDLYKKEVRMTGYPGGQGCTQWTSRSVTERLISGKSSRHSMLIYKAATLPGYSGSPVWRRHVPRRDSGAERVDLAAITVTLNSATVITPFVWKRLSEWMTMM